MDSRQIPQRLSTVNETLEYVSSELCELAKSVNEGKIAGEELFDKLLNLSSVVNLTSGQVEDAHSASMLTEGEELGQAIGQVFFPKFLNKHQEASHDG